MSSVLGINRTSTITVSDLHSLLDAWHSYGGEETLVGRIVMTGRLTREQRRSLSKELVTILDFEKQGSATTHDASVQFSGKIVPTGGPA